MTEIKLNREKIIDFLVEQSLEDLTTKHMLGERITSDNPEAQAILDKPYSPAGEKKLIALNAGDFVLRSYRKGTSQDKGLDLWGDAGEYWSSVGLIEKPEDLGHLFLDIVGLIPVIGVVADLANMFWYIGQERYLYAGLSLFAALPIGGYLANALKLGVIGQKISARAGQMAVKHLPTFIRHGDKLARAGKGLSGAAWKKMKQETTELVTKAAGSKTGVKAGQKLLPPAAAAEVAEAAVRQAEKTSGRVFRREQARAGGEAFARGLKGGEEALGLGARVTTARAAKEVVEKEMAAAAAKIPGLIRQISIAGSTGMRRKGTKELARQVFKAGGDYRLLNKLLADAGSSSTAKTIVAGARSLKGKAAEEFLELAAKAEASGIRIAGRRVTTTYMKKYNVRQLRRAGVLFVKYNVLTHEVTHSDGTTSTVNDDPLQPDVTPTPTPTPGSDLPYGRYKPCKGCLKKMCGGTNVEQLQTLLNKHRPSPIKVDGKFGKRTHKAVVEFQKQNKITPANGQACEDTMAALTGAAAEAPTPTAAPTGSDLTDDEIWNKIEQQIKSKHSDDFSEARMTWLVATVNKVIANEISQGLLKRNDWPSISKRAENLTKSFVVRLSKPGQTLQEEKNMFNVLKERKQQKNNETFDKLIKGLF